MPSRQSVPRIRVDFMDSSPRSLAPSASLDIRDVLNQAKFLPNLLSEDVTFNHADDPLCTEDGHLLDVPPFPVGRRPPLFILHSHRRGLPFHIRLEAFELGDFSWDEEDTRPLLTSPTIPRMKLMVKEQIYVQKWVDNLSSDDPPKHTPWVSEKPVMPIKWVAEGSVFPAAAKPFEKHGAIQERSLVPRRFDETSRSGDLCTSLQASASFHVLTDSHPSISHTLVKSVDGNSGIVRGESKTPHRTVRASQAPSAPTLFSLDLPVGTTSANTNVPLAARRGKSLSSLRLKGGVIEQLEYPDIPTAFLGSPAIWSPRLDASCVPSITDHRTMLLDLRSKCAALGGGVSAYVQEPLCPQTETTHMSLGVDEWAFTLGLATFDNNVSGSNEGQYSGRVTDTSIFLPDGSSTPAKYPGLTAYLGFVPHHHSMLAPQSPTRGVCDPPGVPLPPRPALVSPSTPPHVRGILKKVKSVRFEDTTIVESQIQVSPVTAQASPEFPLPLPLTVSLEKPRTPKLAPVITKPPSDPVPVRLEETPVPGKNTHVKKPTPGSRLPPKRAKVSGKSGLARPNVANAQESSKPTPAPASFERPCRIALAKENLAAGTQAQARQKGASTPETDVRRGLEGPTKSRLSAPLRSIFRFK